MPGPRPGAGDTGRAEADLKRLRGAGGADAMPRFTSALMLEYLGHNATPMPPIATR